MVGTEENKAHVKKVFESAEKNDWSKLDEYYTSDFILHAMAGNPPVDVTLEQIKQMPQDTPPTLSDQTITIEDMVAEGDKVSVRTTVSGKHTGKFSNIEPTGKSVTYAQFSICRFQEGKIAEWWNLANVTGELQQMGVIPPLEEMGNK